MFYHTFSGYYCHLASENYYKSTNETNYDKICNDKVSKLSESSICLKKRLKNLDCYRNC